MKLSDFTSACMADFVVFLLESVLISSFGKNLESFIRSSYRYRWLYKISLHNITLNAFFCWLTFVTYFFQDHYILATCTMTTDWLITIQRLSTEPHMESYIEADINTVQCPYLMVKGDEFQTTDLFSQMKLNWVDRLVRHMTWNKRF